MSTTTPAGPATRKMLLLVWCPRVGEFSARVELDDGSHIDFDCPFELVRFLAAPTAPATTAGEPSGLR